ncbi:hypothetical protein V1460_23090 [Streptomyces sp. SCSIO 30461]|uniref:hypothetical protein n=1 Tax=Streptomyces sp. SCSIO 30461 TaxID=3118085 RepID=UPI0030CEE43B
MSDGHRLDPQPLGDALARIGSLIGDHSTDLWADPASQRCRVRLGHRHQPVGLTHHLGVADPGRHG